MKDVLINRNGMYDYATPEEIRRGKNLFGMFCKHCNARLNLDDVYGYPHNHNCGYVDKIVDKPILKRVPI